MRLSTVFRIAVKNLMYWYYKSTHQNQRIIPYKIVVELTTQCNSRCVTCDIWKIKKEDVQKIDLQQFELFLKTMHHHLLWLALTGGEISSYNQFPEIVALIKKYCPSLNILTFTTNGLMPQRILDFALLMKREINCDVFITISLDGDEHTHDTIRGVKGNYAKCMETYNMLKSHHIPCHFGITISGANHGFIQQSFKTYCDRIKAVTFLHSGGIFLNNRNDNYITEERLITESLEEVYTHYKITSLGEILIKLYIKVGILFMKKNRKTNIIPCDVGMSSAHLMANGDLLPCMYLPPIKRLKDGFSLSDYHSPAAKLMIEEIKKDKCPHCWMSCYGPHSMLQAPIKSTLLLFKSIR